MHNSSSQTKPVWQSVSVKQLSADSPHAMKSAVLASPTKITPRSLLALFISLFLNQMSESSLVFNKTESRKNHNRVTIGPYVPFKRLHVESQTGVRRGYAAHLGLDPAIHSPHPNSKSINCESSEPCGISSTRSGPPFG